LSKVNALYRVPFEFTMYPALTDFVLNRHTKKFPKCSYSITADLFRDKEKK